MMEYCYTVSASTRNAIAALAGSAAVVLTPNERGVVGGVQLQVGARMMITAARTR